MNFAEIQKTLEQMLAVQRELQESQLVLNESQARDRQDIELLIEQSRQYSEEQAQMREELNLLLETVKLQNKNIERLIGYSITNESEHLDTEERFRALEKRIQRLEENAL